MLDDSLELLVNARAQLATVREAMQAALDDQVGQEWVDEELIPLLARLEWEEAELARIERVVGGQAVGAKG